VLIRIDFDWDHRKMTQAKADRLRAVAVNGDALVFTKPDDNGIVELSYGDRPLIAASLLQEFAPCVVMQLIDNESTRALAEFGNKTTTVVNEKCNVAVPGLGMLTIDTVHVETDLCTETLQGLLDDGWRIVAVCVQPDQRRPDYVLGRSDRKGAER